jgi:hypothetical protein
MSAAPDPGLAWRIALTINRIVTGLCYPIIFVIQANIYCEATPANALWFRNISVAIWLPMSIAFHAYMWSSGPDGTFWRCMYNFLFFFSFDYPMWMCILSGQVTSMLLSIDRKENRVKSKKFHGKKILVVGNGPSVCAGEPMGDLIDEFDEVIRFNNFATKIGGLEKFAGTKTTVHFSDAMLYPSYPEYAVPGATVMLSHYDDRLMTAGSYLLLRIFVDWEARATWKILSDPCIWWIPHAELHECKRAIGNTTFHHPTSGMLAIFHFLKASPDEPIYITGFDFFEGAKVHYYDEVEPLYERINDRIGVNMHQPKKEKAYIAKLIEEGKVRWLKDLHAEKKGKK